MKVEVAFASVDKVYLKSLEVPEGTTVAEAIEQSCVKEEFPGLGLDTLKVGVFSELVSGERILQANDRVEIYRPLLIDPREARRQRASQRDGQQVNKRKRV